VRILIVEDEPLLLDALIKSFRDESYAVDSAADGEDALYKARAWDYDLVILDVMLPKLDGWGVLRKLRETKATPVLILTARDGLEDRVRGLDAGADDYVVKPFELEEVLARARALIRRSTGNANPLIRIGNIVIDTAARTVTRDGARVFLTAREYALVEILALHRGKLVTRSIIYEHICYETDDTISKVIEVHVSNVRRKLGKDLISTRRGQGYMIESHA
jgi:two-component system OmpR family response regulator